MSEPRFPADGRVVVPSILLLAACFIATGFSLTAADRSGPLVRAHAHNDYLHARPLADALASGFWSVEADIWLTNGTLLVAHDLDKTDPARTLKALYLEPLRVFVGTNRNVPGMPPFTLLIDLKSAAEPTYAALRGVLRGYAPILTRFESDRIHTNAVMVILSGNRPIETVKGEPERFVAIDGRLSDLAGNSPVSLVPLVSDNWTKHFAWRGDGRLSDGEREKLRGIVGRTHAQGRRIRFWATPEGEAAWRELHREGVDLLNTDRLRDLERFLREME